MSKFGKRMSFLVYWRGGGGFMAKMDQNSDFDQGFWKNGINFTRFKRRGIKKSKFGEKNEFLSILAEGGGFYGKNGSK